MTINLLRGTFGCPCGNHVAPDPYQDSEDWHAAARGDGCSYSGVVDTLEQDPGESATAFAARVQRRCDELTACSYEQRCGHVATAWEMFQGREREYCRDCGAVLSSTPDPAQDGRER